jgi:hypothetical protein
MSPLTIYDSQGRAKRANLSIANPVAMDGWHLVGDASTGLGTAFTSGWSNYNAATEETAGFRKDPFGHVNLKGLVTAPAPTSIAWTLPVGYRPAKTERFVCAHIAGFALIQVMADGSVQFFNIGPPYTGAAGGWLDLSVVEFDTQLVTAYPAGPQGPVGSPPRVTSLTPGTGNMPAAITDGMEVHYVADAANGILWHLKYNAGSASTFKWEFVGGAPLEAVIATDESFAADGLEHDATTVGPQIIAPLSGEYNYDIDANHYHAGSAQSALQTLLALRGTNANAGGGPHIAMMFVVAGGNAFNLPHAGKVTGVVAGDNLRVRYYNNGGGTTNGHVRWRRIAIKPVRVS